MRRRLTNASNAGDHTYCAIQRHLVEACDGFDDDRRDRHSFDFEPPRSCIRPITCRLVDDELDALTSRVTDLQQKVAREE
jgi:hypothetical protein